MFVKDAIHLGKSVQSPPKCPRAETPEVGQWIVLRSCSVSFPLVGSSLRTEPEAGLAARPGPCPAQLQRASQLCLPGAPLFYEQLLLETASLISPGQKQTLQYKRISFTKNLLADGAPSSGGNVKKEKWFYLHSESVLNTVLFMISIWFLGILTSKDPDYPNWCKRLERFSSCWT